MVGQNGLRALAHMGKVAGYDRTSGEPLNVQLVYGGTSENDGPIPEDWVRLGTLWVAPQMDDLGVPGVLFLSCRLA